MKNKKVDDNLDYFLAMVEQQAAKSAITGLETFCRRLTESRNAGRFEECKLLLIGAEAIDMPSYGRALVWYGEGWVNDRCGRWEEAIEAYRESLRLFDAAGMREISSRVWANIGSLYFNRGFWVEADEAYVRALETACDEHSRAFALNNVASLHLIQGKLDEALTTFDQVAKAFDAADDTLNSTAALLNTAAVLRDQGKYQEAQTKIILATIKYQAQKDQRGMAMSMASLALLYQTAGKLAEARIMYEQALPELEKLDLGQYVKTVANMALLEEVEGNAARAQALAERSLAGYRMVGDHYAEVVTLVNLARLCRCAGNGISATAYAKDARRLIKIHGYHREELRLQSLGLAQP